MAPVHPNPSRRRPARRLPRRIAAAAALALLLPVAGAADERPFEADEAETGVAEFTLLGETIAPGERRELALATSETFTGTFLTTPVIVLRGVDPGPVMCLVAGIHGDELNGVEVVRRTLEATDPAHLRGTLIGVPIANLHGFRRSSRYLPDRRDLNRYFPGRLQGSTASRIANRLFDYVIRHCGALVDFHTGSFHRSNLPQIRADLRYPSTRDLAVAFGGDIVIHSRGTPGTLRRAAVEVGIPAVTYEAGLPMNLQVDEVEHGVEGMRRLLRTREMVDGPAPPMRRIEIYDRSRWVRSDRGGILLSHVDLGDRVVPGDELGEVIDPLTNERSPLVSPVGGRVIGMAVNQVVIPGFAAFHIGLEVSGAPRPEGTVDGAVDGPVYDPLDEPFEVDERPE